MFATRHAGTLAVVLAICGAPVARAAQPRAPEVLLVGGQGEATVATAQRTVKDRWYAITVTGSISYNRRLARHDCGHFDPPEEAGWRENPLPHLDGVPAACTKAPPSTSHTYCWTQRGTGAPFVFSMPFPEGSADDDLGALVVVVAPLADNAVGKACASLP